MNLISPIDMNAALERKMRWQTEVLWWIITFILVFVFLGPILMKVPGYLFYPENIVFVIVFITLFRYVFLFRHTFFARSQGVKIALIVLSLPLILYLVNAVNHFMSYVEEEGIMEMLKETAAPDQAPMSRYIMNEYLFLGAGALTGAVFFPIRLMISVWRQENRGTV